MAKTAKAPDYEAAAEKQGASSLENTNYQTHANRPDQVTPWGTQSWQEESYKDPVTGKQVPRWTQTTQLSPDQQRALDAQTNLTAGRSELGAGMLGRIQDEFAPIVNYDDFDAAGARVKSGKLGTIGNGPALQGDLQERSLRAGLQGADAYQGKAGDALMEQFNSRMDPQFQRDQASQDTVLRNRGLKPGDEAYDTELAKMRQGQGDQRNQAMYQAQQLSAQEAERLQGMDKTSKAFGNDVQSQRFAQEAQRLGFSNDVAQKIYGNLIGATGFNNDTMGRQFSQDMQGSQYDTQRRQQQIAEENMRRGQSLNEANALITGQQVQMPSMPTFNTAGRAETTGYSQAAGQQYQAAQDAANAQNAMTGQIMGAVSAPFSFGG